MKRGPEGIVPKRGGAVLLWGLMSSDLTSKPEKEDAPQIPFLGARRRARELAAEVAELRVDQERLGLRSVVELEQMRGTLAGEIEAQRMALAATREQAKAALTAELQNDRLAADERLEATRTAAVELESRLAELRQEVVVTEETSLLQEVGIYDYRHPLSDAVAYQEKLARVRAEIKSMTKRDGGAVLATTNWSVNGSAAQGRTMVRDFSKLMLRAYNAEADNLVRGMKPYKLDSAIERLQKVAVTIVKLGKTMDIRISQPYHGLRVHELELTADYLAKVAEQKEAEREERERLREERKVQQEMQRERERLEKERQHYENAMAALLDQGEADAAARMKAEIDEIAQAIEQVDYRAANIRAGYVYVISNLGSFGDGVVKVGLTRRLDPRERVRELGDASVPFKYDVHALFFSDDAVGIESKLHSLLADRRVNRVNLRREFFYATPVEVKTHLQALAGDGELLEFAELAEALEFRQSRTVAAVPAA
jgi:hypothetical protein